MDLQRRRRSRQLVKVVPLLGLRREQLYACDAELLYVNVARLSLGNQRSPPDVQQQQGALH